ATDSLISRNTIEINYNGAMDTSEVLNVGNYIWDNGVTVQSIAISNPRNTIAKITLTNPLDSNIIYHLKIPSFSGCVGYIHLEDNFEYAITREPNAGELILNEILFQPNSNVSQFVEIYNKSSSLFKVKDLMLSQENVITGNETATTDISNANGYVFPNDYLVFSKDKNSVKTVYEDAVLSKFIDLTIPTFDTKEDIVLLKNKSNVILDKLHYNRDWHFPLLRTTIGVSLEKTAFDLPTQVKRYWHSAAEEVGLATPGYLNSEDSYELLGDVHIIPEVFSPDGDGIDDVATITYNFDDDGSVVNAYLYNSDGRLVNHLVHNETISKEGVFIWNGNNENDNKNDIGIYFLVFERIKADGKKLVYKRKCVLAGKLN
ncbi:MAG TPA: gliding motility-associated C-terminal domain-containing protein, partial [Chitinophagales bacterium]|nr:gliding motility-associated C-terminal domain-containing protein [Chitinophagales bacterium]